MTEAVMTIETNDPYEMTRTMWKWFCPTSVSAITPKQFLVRSYGAGDRRQTGTAVALLDQPDTAMKQ
jgi:hypothetical protein